MAVKIAGGVAVGLLALLALTQIFIPPLVEGKVEDRLERGGGDAKVSVGAFPAVRLLWGDGGKFEATGNGLEIDLQDRERDPLRRLNGFDEVDIRLTNLDAGAISVRRFGLERDSDAPAYYLRLDALTTPRDLAETAGAEVGGGIGSLLGGLAGTVLPGAGSTEIPVEVEGEVDRRPGGGVDVDDVDASVAGLPAGPFAELMVQAVLDRL